MENKIAFYVNSCACFVKSIFKTLHLHLYIWENFPLLITLPGSLKAGDACKTAQAAAAGAQQFGSDLVQGNFTSLAGDVRSAGANVTSAMTGGM